MPPAFTFFSRSRLALPAGGAIAVGIGVLLLLHLAAAAVLLHTEDDLTARLAFLLTWGLLNFLWLLLLRRPSVAASLSLIMVVVLILLSQFKQDILIMSANFVDVLLIDADTASFLLTIFPGLAAKSRGRSPASCCRCSCCSGGSIRFACGCARRRSAPAFVSPRSPACRSPCRWTARRRSSRPTTCRSSRAPARWRSTMSPRAASWSPTAPLRDRLSTAAPASCKPGAAAAAHHPRARRVELRHQHGRRRQGAAGLSEPLPLVRRQGAHVPGRRRRRPDLVHRVQRAQRIVDALVWPLRRVRDADRRRSRDARACRTRCTIAAIAPTASIPGLAPFSARAVSRRRSASIISMTPRTSRPATSSRTNSITPSPRIC